MNRPGNYSFVEHNLTVNSGETLQFLSANPMREAWILSLNYGATLHISTKATLTDNQGFPVDNQTTTEFWYDRFGDVVMAEWYIYNSEFDPVPFTLLELIQVPQGSRSQRELIDVHRRHQDRPQHAVENESYPDDNEFCGDSGSRPVANRNHILPELG